MGLLFCVCFCNDVSPPQDAAYHLRGTSPGAASLSWYPPPQGTHSSKNWGKQPPRRLLPSEHRICVWTASPVPAQGFGQTQTGNMLGQGLWPCSRTQWGPRLRSPCPRAPTSHPRCGWPGTGSRVCSALTLEPSRQGTLQQLPASGQDWPCFMWRSTLLLKKQTCHTILPGPQEPRWPMTLPAVPQQGSFPGNQGSKQISATQKLSSTF